MSKIETQGLPRERTDSDLRAEYGESGVPDAPFAEHCHHLRNRPGVMRSLYNLYANWVSFRVLDEFSKPPGFPPILLFWGRSNRILPLAAGEELARRLKPDQFEIVDGCGQMVFREQPELVNKRTDDFLKRRIAMSPASAGAPTLERSPAAGA
jgi:pimeloyl-ACP methyl ester carboxylesterase